MAEVKKPTAKVIPKATPVKVAEKTEAAKPVKKVAVKKEPIKKAAVKKEPVKKAALKESVNLQFDGKSYTTEDLLGICKDVWKYDLNGKPTDLKSIELYVKPEENTAYYVINGELTGSFQI